MKNFLMKVNSFTIYIAIIVMCALSVVNMVKSGGIMKTALENEELVMPLISGLPFLMGIQISICAILLAVAGYKYFAEKERNHIYIAGMICAVFLLLASWKGIAVSGYFSGESVPMEGEELKVVMTLFEYIGLSKLVSWMLIGVSGCTVLKMVKGGELKFSAAPKREIGEEAKGNDEHHE